MHTVRHITQRTHPTFTICVSVGECKRAANPQYIVASCLYVCACASDIVVVIDFVGGSRFMGAQLVHPNMNAHTNDTRTHIGTQRQTDRQTDDVLYIVGLTISYRYSKFPITAEQQEL